MVSIPFEQGDVFRRNKVLFHIEELVVSIPFEQGDVFRRNKVLFHIEELVVSIPFEQGDVFRPVKTTALRNKMGLNPFRAGRCLSTNTLKKQ